MSRRPNPLVDNVLIRWGAWRRGEIRGLGVLGYPNMTPYMRHVCAPGGSHDRTPDYFTEPEIAQANTRLQALPAKIQLALWCNFVRIQYERDKLADERRCAVICGVDGRQAYGNLLKEAMEAAAEALGMKAYIYSGDPERWKKKLLDPTPSGGYVCASVT